MSKVKKLDVYFMLFARQKAGPALVTDAGFLT